jgi:mycofactocin system creatininase family protein
VIAEALAAALADRRADCTVAPALAITASGEHQGFPGTLSIGKTAMTSVVVELVRSADWSGGVVLVNGHGGNAAAVERAVAVLHGEQRRVLAWWPKVPGSDLHAGRIETSLMLALAPEHVQSERATAGPVPAISELVQRGVLALSPSGVLGDPAGSTAGEGRQLFDALVEQLVEAVDEWVGR